MYHPSISFKKKKKKRKLQILSLIAPPPDQHPGVVDQAQCKYGRVYVYDDLPPIFNKKLLENCIIDSRKSQCEALSDGGFGPEATTALAGIVPPELARAWYRTHMFASELIFHNRILNYKCRTMEPESAKAFYIPFYAGLAASNILFSGYTAKERDAPFYTFLEWIKNQHYWKRSNGSDHFLAVGRTSWDLKRVRDDQAWGTSFLLMPLMRKMFSFTIERSLGDPMEVTVPYPTGFHPRTVTEIKQWQEFVRGRKRTNLFTFVGGKRGYIKNDFRALLLDHCYNESDSCKAIDFAKTACLDSSSAVLEIFLSSDFCLQPRGDSHTRRSTFDCMQAAFGGRTGNLKDAFDIAVEEMLRRIVSNKPSLKGPSS
ncbi:xyloglucan galactosyltransferase XLT2-like [Coffea arabica]|uniref:Xyloglucan galactosyltransferase XLT2-like n=1 Tax=Coffea arabica TaxID=13443 RepID=A0A6P6SN76_COFAR|nr:xyloglucan galactosyltransferase XLT2-like [Coffea arabica]